MPLPVADLVLPVLVRLRDRIESKGSRRGLVYPWWIPLFSTGGQVVATVAALAQRHVLVPPHLLDGALVLVIAVSIAQFLARPWVSWLLYAPLVLGATAWMVANPVPAGTVDVAPSLAMLLTAEVVVTEGIGPALLVAGVSAAIVAVAAGRGDLHGFWFYLLGLVLSLSVGYMLRWQMRALAAERTARAGERSRATLAERERIAREIHDLVAHSLSVTLLHLTGARHALADGGDVGEALEALTDAEAVGRQAMADIRRTVGALADGPSPTEPLPDAADIARLVDQFAGAGLAVEYAVTGDLARLAPGAGLGLYRITQEALANVAKHVAGAHAHVSLDVRRDRAHLIVRNDLPAGRPRGSGDGSGLPGMAARAEGMGATLVAGTREQAWVVEVRLPLDERCSRLTRRWADAG